MKIAITTVQAPFIFGGAEFLANNLKAELIKSGHEAEIVSIPLMADPPNVIVDSIVASRLYDLTYGLAGKIDLCIGLKFPAYFIPHDNKVAWVLHQFRGAYDLFDTEYSNLKNNLEGNYIRNIIKNADNTYLKEEKRIYTIADNITNRMQKFNGIKAQTLYHPCPDMDKFFEGEYEDYILMPSRINLSKRQMLAIEAMKYTKSNIKLYIVGKSDTENWQKDMLDLIKMYKLQDRIKYFDYVSQEEKFKLYANAKAVLFIPIDEDYGYITLEAMAAAKAVITAKDSGGPLEFVINNHNGMIVDNTPQEIAKAIDAFAESKTMAKDMGKAAKEHISDMNISWDNVIKEFTKK